MALVFMPPLPSVLPSFLLLLLSVLLILLLLQKRRNASKTKLPPGPKKLPIIGNLHQLGSLPHHSLHKLANLHGPLMFMQLGCIPAIVVSSTELIRKIATDHDVIFSNRPVMYSAKRITYGCRDIACAPYGEYWRQVRKICMIELLSHKRVQSFRAVREEEVASLVATIKTLSSSSSPPQPVNLSKLLHLVINSITCRAAFGDKYGVTDYCSEERSRFYQVLWEAQELLGGFCIGDFFPFLKWIHAFDGLGAKLENVCGELDKLYDVMIDEHLVDQQNGHSHNDLLHVLLGLREDPTYKDIFTTRDNIKGVIQDVFIAATDTATSTAVWAMAALMKNPRVMDKAQQELRSVVGNKSMVQESDLQNIHYLKLVVNEALRLYPPAPLPMPRETLEACKINGYDIPAKTRVYFNARAVAMDENIWKSPQEFWPERFLEYDDVKIKDNSYSYIPFGVGRRMCPGGNFGKMMLELTLANLLYSFNWTLPHSISEKDLDMEEQFGLTINKKEPLLLFAKP